MVSKERLRTVSPDHKSGVIMDRRLYEQVKKFILHVLDSHDEVTLNELLNYAPIQFHKELGENAGWFIYKVKLDLEARGLIKQRSIRNSRQSVTKKMRKKSTIEIQQSTFEVFATQSEVNQTVKDKFIELFGKQPLMIHSPGRINLIGEHTDYNNGFVMPAAIDKGIQFAVAPSKSNQSVIYSLRYHEYFTVDHSKIARVDTPVWANYLLGILYQMNSKGFNVRPFNCVFDGDLPLGAGLSSSAAMECGFAFALNELNQLNLSNLEMIHMAQWSEHNYVSVKCGIMDQFTSMMGKEGYAMLLDCQWLTHKFFPIQLNGHVLVLCNTNVKHSLASSEYNTRREECEMGVKLLQSKYPSIKSLRDVTRKMLVESAALLPDKVYKRCLYVVEENGRVQKASEDLKNGNLRAFGKKMVHTHNGLSNLYEVSCPELDFLVCEAKKFNGVIGARMMGGGFGGCTLNIVRENHLGEFIMQMKRKYKEQFSTELTIHVVKTGNGTSVIEIPDKWLAN